MIANSFTAIRGEAVGGPFEALLLILVAIFSFFKLLNNEKVNYLFLIPFLFLVFFMAPLTFANSFSGLMGSDIRTLVALMYVSLIAFPIAHSSIEEQKFIAYGAAGVLLLTFILALIIEIDLNNLSRLVLFSNNPNQIALYSLCSLFLIARAVKQTILSIILCLPALFYGLLSLSDTYILSLSIIFFFICLQYLAKGKYLMILLIAWIISGITFWIILTNFTALSSLIDIWAAADEGNTRINLALNGFQAFLQSPIFGYGAGAFSGPEFPMMGMEAHNTVIDFLTMGGVIWVLIFYTPFIIAILSFFKEREIVFAGILISILVFSIFHFIGRHPVIWFLYAICISSIFKKQKQEI